MTIVSREDKVVKCTGKEDVKNDYDNLSLSLSLYKIIKIYEVFCPS